MTPTRLLLLTISVLFWCNAAVAQSPLDLLVPEAEPAAETAEAAVASDPVTYDGPPTLANIVPDYGDWESVAQRAETTLGAGGSSAFALDRLRDELFGWREAFSAVTDGNSGRIATLTAQLAALGPVPDGRPEADEVTARRQTLQQQLATLSTPDRLAEEAVARASGLIAEIDAQIRSKQAKQLRVRAEMPVHPVYWPPAFSDATMAIDALVAITGSNMRRAVGNGVIWQNLPILLIYFSIAAVLLLRGRRLMAGVQPENTGPNTRWRAVVNFAFSLGQILVPLVGLLALIAGFEVLNLWDMRARHLFNALFEAGAVVIIARWLNNQLFPVVDPGPLQYDDATRFVIRRTGIALSWGLGVLLAIDAVMRVADVAQISIAVISMPVLVVVSWFLFRLGRNLAVPPVDDTVLPGSTGRMRKVIGLFCTAVAIGTPVLSGLGYAAASAALFRPAVLTLAILGVVIVLQRLVYDIFASTEDAQAEDAEPLLPVVIGFSLFVLALPFLALTWGARIVDLQEIWTRFSTGFALGQTRISPTDFITLVVVFIIGYLLTRSIQGALRKTVLPRTKIDLGGQNAIVSGFGYIGIAVATVMAITAAGIDLTSLAFVAGALSVGIGFGLQNIVQNFVSGIILLIERPISEGDMIEVNGQLGYVKDISVRSTRIQTFDYRDVIVPNADLVSNQVTNWTRGNLAGRIIVKVGVAYGSNVEQVKTILRDIAISHPMALADPAPQVFFTGFGASSLDFEVRMILRDVAWMVVTTSEVNEQIDAKFREAGIEIPFPQRDLWLRNPQDLNVATKGDTP